MPLTATLLDNFWRPLDGENAPFCHLHEGRGCAKHHLHGVEHFRKGCALSNAENRRKVTSELGPIRPIPAEERMQSCFEIETARICIFFLYPALTLAMLGFITYFVGWFLGPDVPRFTQRYYFFLLKIRGRPEFNWYLAGFSETEVKKILLARTYLTAIIMVSFVPIGIICIKVAGFLGSVIFSCSSPI